MNNPESLMPSLSVKRPVTVLMIFLALLVTGTISYKLIPVELFPQGFSPPYLGVWVTYRTSNPQEIEDQITKPAEEQFRTVRGLKEISSYSSSNGVWIWLEFQQNTDMNLAYMQVSDRIERARLEWPEDQRYVWINRFSESDEPIYFFGVKFDSTLEDPYYLIENKIKKRLERVTGVAKVETWGTYEKIIQIEIDADRAKAYHINTYNLVNDLMGDNFSFSSGYVSEGNKKFYLRSLGQFKTLDEIKRIPINRDGLKLSDVARVTYDVPERRFVQRIDQKPSAMVAVYKESSANTVELASKLDAEVKQFEADKTFRGMEFSVLFNQATHILTTVNDLKVSGLWGGFFAMLVLFFFLRRIFMTSIITLAIPLSLLISLMVMYFIDWTLNVMTMMGLMITVGLVIDNSIVVVENIHVRKLAGDNPVKASIGGASEVAMAVTLATLTTVVVFLPLIIINDDVGFRFYMMQIGFPVIFALLASLGVSLLFIPLAAKYSISNKEIAEPRIVEWGKNKVQKAVSWSLNHRLDAVIIALVVLLSLQIPMSKISKTDEASGNINDFRLRFDIPNSFSIQKTDKMFGMFEDLLLARKDDYDIKTISSRFSNNWGQIQVFLNTTESSWWKEAYDNFTYSLGIRHKTKMTREEVIEDIKQNFPKIPGVKMFTSWHDRGSSGNSVTVHLTGDDTGKLLEISDDVKRILRQIPEINSVGITQDQSKDEIRILLDNELLNRAGLTPRQVAYTISYALRGYELPELRNGDKEITVRTQYLKEDRETLEQLKNIRFAASNGQEIPLSAIAQFRVEKGLGEIHRLNGKTSIEVEATTTKDDLQQLSASIDQVMKGYQMPRGYEWSKGRRFDNMEESDMAQNFAIMMAITFVFLLMGVLFESFILPLSVIVSIPFSFFGAYWLLYLTGSSFDIMAGIGLIILIGVVVNNAIVLIDLANRLRNDGFERTEALMEASRRRFRPIAMTALTTICGLLPMAVGNSSLIGIPYAPLGRVIIGGIATSTIFTLVFVPLFYTFFDDLREFWKRILSTLLAKKGSEVTAVAGQTGGGGSVE